MPLLGRVTNVPLPQLEPVTDPSTESTKAQIGDPVSFVGVILQEHGFVAVLVVVSVAVTKHRKQLWEDRLQLSSQGSPIPEGSQARTLEAATHVEAVGRVLLHMVCSACFLLEPGTTSPGMAVRQVCPFHISHCRENAPQTCLFLEVLEQAFFWATNQLPNHDAKTKY